MINRKLLVGIFVLAGMAGAFSVHAEAPTITSISPSSKTVGDAQFTITINGTKFNRESVVNFNGSPRQTTYQSQTKVSATIPASDLVSAGTFNITVTNPNRVNTAGGFALAVSPDGAFVYLAGPDGGVEKLHASTLVRAALINTGPRFQPYHLAVSPNSAYVYVAGYNGIRKYNASNLAQLASITTSSEVTSVSISPDGNYVYGILRANVVRYNASDLSGPVYPSTGLGAIRDLTVSPDGSYLYVVNSSGTIYKLNAANLSIANFLNQFPNGYNDDSLRLSITYNGRFLFLGSWQNFGNFLKKVDTNSLTVISSVSASPSPFNDSSAVSPDDNYVYIATQNGGKVEKFRTSNVIQVTAGNSWLPLSVAVSPDGAYVYTVNALGSPVSESTIKKFLASDMSAIDLGSGGGTSNAKPFTVNNPVPTVASLSPSSATEGGPAFTLTVQGTKFVSNSTIYWNNFGLATAYVSSTKLTAQISSVPSAGTYYITVVNPAPGGGTSNTLPFVVNPPATGYPPTADMLSVSSDVCTLSPSVTATFSWKYQDQDGDNQFRFQLQIARRADPNFTKPVVDRTFSNLSNPSGTVNQQVVFVQNAPTPDSLLFLSSYYWRVKVWQVDSQTGGAGADSGWVYNGPAPGVVYTTPRVPGPTVDFTYDPQNPLAGSPVAFTENATCYGGPCQAFNWLFGDGGTSNLQNPSYTYNNPGTYNVNLKVSDNFATCEATQPIVVGSGGSGKFRWREISPFY